MKDNKRSAGRLLVAAGAVGAACMLAACAASTLKSPIVGYTCCNLTAAEGWISSNNVQGGAFIGAGEPVQLTSIKRQYYVYGTVGHSEFGFRDDNAKKEADTLEWLGRIVVAEDPRPQIATWPADVRLAVGTARVKVGMTRLQVLTALGHPARADTPDLDGSTWRYWTSIEDEPVDLVFDGDRLASLQGKASAVRRLEL
jgi:hypothetical protein